MIRANAEQLQQLMDNSDFIAEFRRAPETAEFFVEQNIAEQKEWVNELCSRLKFTSSNATICVLDTGLNNGHPLLKDVTDDRLIQTVNETWGAADRVGHGTEMCGVATFFDLQACLESDKPIEVAHRIESVKIIPDGDSDANDPELYGDITRQAIYLSEIENPQVNRVICLAITSDKYNTDDSRVNMIIQGELSPYTRLEDQRIGTNEMHIYELPWPKEELLSLGDMPITMRITLSYFIEPGPGAIGWKDRYRYPSCLLRFDLKNKNEDVEDFKKRINRAARDDEKDSGDGSSGSERWYLGKKNRDVGSIHSDIWTGTAADLSQCNHIGIFPAIGWWKERKYLNCYQKKIRYSLVVSLESPDTEIDLYTPIKIQITPPVAPPIAHPASRA